jgi:transposase-like protein
LRLVAEAMKEDPSLSLNAAVKRIGPRVGIVADTLRGWAKQRRVDTGQQAGTTSSDAARIKELERENRELKRANEILLGASSFFARSSTRDFLTSFGVGRSHSACSQSLAGFRVSAETADRYREEGLRMQAEHAPGLHEAPARVAGRANQSIRSRRNDTCRPCGGGIVARSATLVSGSARQWPAPGRWPCQ